MSDKQQVRELIDKLLVVAEHSSERKLFRGEAECYPEISSGLYRQLHTIKNDNFNIMEAQERQLSLAKSYTKITDDFEILSQIQHHGGKTNLIDFTTDLNIALFFACYYSPGKNGRVIFLPYPRDNAGYTVKPAVQPSNMADAQKSIFVVPSRGYIREKDTIIVEIPHELKSSIIEYLGRVYGIEAATVYNDISGFIRDQEDLKDHEAEFYAGANYNRAGDFEKAIEHYTNYLEHPSTIWRRGQVYFLRCITYFRLGFLQNAFEDYREYDRKHWPSKPEMPSQLVNTFENMMEQEQTQNDERELQSENLPEQNLISRIYLTARDEYENPVEGVNFAYISESGYGYEQEISESDSGILITVPTDLYTYRQDITDWFWFRKDDYKSVNGVEFQWNTPSEFTMIPHRGNGNMLKITIRVEPRIYLGDRIVSQEELSRGGL